MNLPEGIQKFIKDWNLERLKNKYLIATVLFVVWIGFLDQNNLAERYRNLRELRQLEKDRIYYEAKIEEVTARLNELKTNNDNLEKFAREQYLMKKDNEDVFVIVRE